MNSFESIEEGGDEERATEDDRQEVNEVRKLEYGDRWRRRERLKAGSGCMKEEEP